MNRRRAALLASIVLGTLVAADPCTAQVERVAVRTTGISCGTCAAVSEIYLRRLAGVDVVKISLSNEAVMLVYRAGAAFRPKQIRDALKKTSVGIVQFQIRVRGRVEQRDCVRFLEAGGERFLLTIGPGTTAPAAGTTVMVEGTLIDRADPMVLAVRSITAAP